MNDFAERIEIASSASIHLWPQPGSGVRWSMLAAERPELAEAGRALLYQFGVGLAFLVTVRKDGGPRVHPPCPLITTDAIYMLVTASYKRQDLHRDQRYALHSYPWPPTRMRLPGRRSTAGAR